MKPVKVFWPIGKVNEEIKSNRTTRRLEHLKLWSSPVIEHAGARVNPLQIVDNQWTNVNRTEFVV